MGTSVVALLGLGLAGAIGGWGASAATVWVDREAAVLGQRLRVELAAETEAAAAAAVERIFETAVGLERTLVSAAAGSGLGALNESATGTHVPVEPPVFDLLMRVWDFAGRTDGAFDPTVRSLGVEEPPSTDREALVQARRSSGRGCFDLSPSSRTIARRCPDARIDVGAIGTGAMLAAIDAVLESEGIGTARVDFGRQSLLRGDLPGEAGLLRIPFPDRPGRTAFEWAVPEGSVAIRLRAPAAPRGGDAASGARNEPVGLAGAAVVVRSDDPIEADALATALLAMGPERAVRWLAARPRLEAGFLVASAEGWRACGRLSVIGGWSVAAVRAIAPEDDRLAAGLIGCPDLPG